MCLLILAEAVDLCKLGIPTVAINEDSPNNVKFWHVCDFLIIYKQTLIDTILGYRMRCLSPLCGLTGPAVSVQRACASVRRTA